MGTSNLDRVRRRRRGLTQRTETAPLLSKRALHPRHRYNCCGEVSGERVLEVRTAIPTEHVIPSSQRTRSDIKLPKPDRKLPGINRIGTEPQLGLVDGKREFCGCDLRTVGLSQDHTNRFKRTNARTAIVSSRTSRQRHSSSLSTLRPVVSCERRDGKERFPNIARTIPEHVRHVRSTAVPVE